LHWCRLLRRCRAEEMPSLEAENDMLAITPQSFRREMVVEFPPNPT
jgi:hypothetical protein